MKDNNAYQINGMNYVWIRSWDITYRFAYLGNDFFIKCVSLCTDIVELDPDQTKPYQYIPNKEVSIQIFHLKYSVIRRQSDVYR